MWLSVFTAGSLLPALAVPVLTVRLKRTWLVVVTLTLGWAVGLAGLCFWPLHGTWWWILASRIGDGYYACALTLMNLRTRDPRTLLAVSGFGQAIGYTVTALVTFLFGQIHAWSAGWLWPMLLLIGIVPLGLVGGLLASRPAYVEDQIAATARL
jgi:CP family cyanate transporter-like MFS transporter